MAWKACEDDERERHDRHCLKMIEPGHGQWDMIHDLSNNRLAFFCVHFFRQGVVDTLVLVRHLSP